MAETHSPRERVQLYRKGFTRGAAVKAIPPELAQDPDFDLGYQHGRKTFNEAMEWARKFYGAPPPTWLKVQDGDTPAPARGD
jgi:hypothetical protein